MAVKETEVEEYAYTLLEPDDRRAMVKMAVKQIEKLLFETELNITINTPEHELVTHNEDGSTHTQTLADRKEMLERQLQDMKVKYRGFLV